MKWIWNLTPDNFRNMCPYFWMTNLNVLIFIPFSILKLLFLGWMYTIHLFSKKTEIGKAKRFDNLVQKVLKGDVLAFDKLWSKRDWPDIQKLLGDKAEELYIAWNDYTVQQRLVENRESREVFIGKLTRKIKFVSKLIGIAFLVVIYYYLILFIDFLVDYNWRKNINWSELKYVGLVFLYIISLITLVVSVFKLFQNNIIDFVDYLFEKKVGKKIVIGFSYLAILAYPFIWLWKGIRLIWDIIVAIKSNNCPGIDWK